MSSSSNFQLSFSRFIATIRFYVPRIVRCFNACIASVCICFFFLLLKRFHFSSNDEAIIVSMYCNFERFKQVVKHGTQSSVKQMEKHTKNQFFLHWFGPERIDPFEIEYFKQVLTFSLISVSSLIFVNFYLAQRMRWVCSMNE